MEQEFCSLEEEKVRLGQEEPEEQPGNPDRMAESTGNGPPELLLGSDRAHRHFVHGRPEGGKSCPANLLPPFARCTRLVHVQLVHRRLLSGLSAKLTLGLVLGLACVGIPFFLSFYHFHRNQLLEGLKSSTSSLSQLVVGSLQSAMLRETPHILQEEVTRLSQRSGVERIMILDKNGTVRISSDEQMLGTRFNRDRDPTCLVCHRFTVPERQSTTVAESPSGRVFRNMNLIVNEARCHRCHDPEESVNGILIMDLSMAGTERQLTASIRHMLIMAGVMVVLTIVVLWFLMKKLILKRLKRFMEATGLIREGRLEQSVPVDSLDEIGRLAESFNVMTGSLRDSFEELKHQRQFLENVIDTIRDEIVVFDKESNVVTANQAARDRWLHEGGDADSSLARETFTMGHPGKRLEVTPTSAGGERHLEIHTYPRRNEEGTVFQVIQVARDISERKYLEAHLSHSERLASLGLLASGFSHEINNPLGAIATCVEGLRRRLASQGAVSADWAQETLSRISNQIDRARRITTRLLNMARPPGKTRSLIDVNRVVEDTLAVLSYDLKRGGVIANKQLSPEIPPLCDDESRLSQILMNLTLNSIQAMANGGGFLRVATAADDGTIRIEVEDTGEGIPRENLRKIYEPFFTTKPVGKGTGLGLFITHRLVAEMEGTIEVRSQPGEGSLFTIHLPSRGKSER